MWAVYQAHKAHAVFLLVRLSKRSLKKLELKILKNSAVLTEFFFGKYSCIMGVTSDTGV